MILVLALLVMKLKFKIEIFSFNLLHNILIYIVSLLYHKLVTEYDEF